MSETIRYNKKKSLVVFLPIYIVLDSHNFNDTHSIRW